MSSDSFYKSVRKTANRLIKYYGKNVTIYADNIILNPTTGTQTKVSIVNTTVKSVAKIIKTALIQDRFYETAELSIIVPHGSFDYIDKYKYYVLLDGQKYEVIRHRSIRPGAYELLIEIALRRSGTGVAK